MRSTRMAVAVLALAAGPASVPNGDELDVAAAREGLARMIEATSGIAPTEAAECPLVGRDQVDAAFALSGVDAPLGEWWLLVDHGRGVGVACTGSYVGPEDDPSFPELEIELWAVDVGSGSGSSDVAGASEEPITVTDLPDGTVGTCAADRFVTVCEELWHHDGFAVGLLVTDRVAFDRVTASTILGELVPIVVANLAGDSADVADPLRDVTAAQVVAATAGLDRFVAANAEAVDDDRERLDCPAAAEEDVAKALADAGIDADLEGWTASLDPVTFPDDLDPTPMRLTCTGGTDPEARVIVVDFADPVAADEFVASVGLAAGGSPDDLVPGDLTVGSCTDASGLRFCTEWWRDGGLVVGVWLTGDSAPIGDGDAAGVLVDLVPEVLVNLAAVGDDRASS